MVAVAAGEGARVDTNDGVTTVHAGRTVVIPLPSRAQGAPPSFPRRAAARPRQSRARRVANRARAPSGDSSDSESDPHPLGGGRVPLSAVPGGVRSVPLHEARRAT
jgi:hypothetical protein